MYIEKVDNLKRIKKCNDFLFLNIKERNLKCECDKKLD